MKTIKQIHCAACNEGIYEEVEARYEVTVADNIRILIDKLTLLRCPKCGDELIPPTSQEQIDRAISEQTEQLSRLELQDMADTFDLDQTQISEVLGLGGKTFHRWLKGTQYPSRSMGYYLRVLAKFPEAFAWLKARGWRNQSQTIELQNTDLSGQYPDLVWLNAEVSLGLNNLNQRQLLSEDRGGRRFNPVSAFRETKII